MKSRNSRWTPTDINCWWWFLSSKLLQFFFNLISQFLFYAVYSPQSSKVDLVGHGGVYPVTLELQKLTETSGALHQPELHSKHMAQVNPQMNRTGSLLVCTPNGLPSALSVCKLLACRLASLTLNLSKSQQNAVEWTLVLLLCQNNVPTFIDSAKSYVAHLPVSVWIL